MEWARRMIWNQEKRNTSLKVWNIVSKIIIVMMMMGRMKRVMRRVLSLKRSFRSILIRFMIMNRFIDGSILPIRRI